MVITGTASTLPILSKGAFERALKARRYRPMFVVDFAVPRDVEPDASELEDLFLYTIDDLGTIVSEGAGQRQAAVAEAEAIVDRQVESFQAWLAARGAVPAIVQLRAKADEYRAARARARRRQRLAKGEDPAKVLESTGERARQQAPAPPHAGAQPRRGRRARFPRARHRDPLPRQRQRPGRIEGQ